MKNALLFKITCLAAAAAFVNIPAGLHAAGTTTINAAFTSTINDNNLDGTGDGSQNNMRVGETEAGTYNQIHRSLVRFDMNPNLLAPGEQITSAIFRIYIFHDAQIGSGNPTAGNYVDSFRGISDVKLYWSNDSKNLGVTMTNDFYQNATFQNTNKIIVKTEHEAGSTEHQLMGWIEVDVTSFVQAEFAAQASESTVRAWLRLQADLWAGVAKGNGTALRFGFDGLDRANPPQLVITTAATSIPEPRVTGFFILIPAGLLAFVLRRKYHP